MLVVKIKLSIFYCFFFKVKRVVASRNLKENFKFSVKVNNSHVYFQTKSDKEKEVLTKQSNMPQNWLKSPTSEQVDIFTKNITKYEKEAKTVRKILVNDWAHEVVEESKKSVGPVVKLSYLRSLRENVWPCPQCSELGKLYFENMHLKTSFYSVQDKSCECGFNPNVFDLRKTPYDFCPPG